MKKKEEWKVVAITQNIKTGKQKIICTECKKKIENGDHYYMDEEDENIFCSLCVEEGARKTKELH